MSFLDPITAAGPAGDLLTTGEPVNVANSDAPNPGDVLTAVDSTHATWQPPSGGGGGGGGGGGDGGNAGGLETTGAPVDVASAAPPVPGQVLTALDETHATWRVPGLHYDPSIKFWTSSTGSATILPGSWGFIQQPPEGTAPVVVYIVSSLDAPPVDSRFGLYVGRDVTVPVSVNVLGASQIQGLDGELGPSTPLLPGADYEWVFYHEDSAALWGLVSDTAAAAKRLWVDGGMVELRTSPPPNPGDVLTALDAEQAVWAPPTAPAEAGLVYATGTAPGFGQWVIAANGIDSQLPTPTETGQRVGVYVPLNVDGVSAANPDVPIYLNRNAFTPTANLLPGGWYEWASISTGESFAWVPHGGSGHESNAPLEESLIPGLGTWPNQWVMSSTASGVMHTPENPINGDSFGAFVTTSSASVVPATGQAIISPDGTTTVNAPSSLTLAGPSYYEWIWIDSTAQWNPKSVRSNAGAGLIRTGSTLAVGANADGSIVVNADDIRVGVLATDAQHGVRGGGTLHAVATTSVAGFQAAADKVKSDALSQAYKDPVRAVAIADITLSGLQTVDGVSLVANDRVLLAGQATASQCGIYIVSAGAWIRATDADTSIKLNSGALVPVSEGTVYLDTIWSLTTNAPITLGTTSIAFQVIGGLRGTGNTPRTIAAGFNSAAVGSLNKWAAADHIHPIVTAYKEPVRVVSNTNIAALTGLLTVDSVTLVANDRVLLTGQTTATQNGIWVASTGAWSRSADANTSQDLVGGTIVPVTEGTTYADTDWVLTTNNPIVLGTTNLTFSQSGSLRGAGAFITAIVPAPTASNGAVPKWAAIDHGHAYSIPDPTPNGFRLSTSLTSPAPVDGTYSTIFLAPYKSNKIALWDTTLGLWQIVTNPVVNSAALASHAAGIPVDVFARYIGSSNSLAIDLVNWNNATTRASALTTQDGITVRSGGTNARYIGTFLPDSATTFSHISSASNTASPVGGIWNQDNRIKGQFTWTPTFDTWTIPTANTWQSLNGQASAKVQYVQGQSIDIVSAVHIGAASGLPGGSLGIGLDSTSAATGLRDFASNSNPGSLRGQLSQLTPAGVHNLNAIANGGANTIVFYGAHAPMQGGITAELWY